MADVTPAKNNIDQNEVDYRSAVSEQLLTKLGGSINFINDRQMCVFDFKFFGPFKTIAGGEEGAHVLPYNIEICAISFRLRDCGSSGNTTVDLHKINSSGVDQGSIFTNKIIVAHNETDQKGFFSNFIASTSNNVSQSASQMPTMTDSNRLINAGESIRLDVDGNATDAKDLVVYVYYRPV